MFHHTLTTEILMSRN